MSPTGIGLRHGLTPDSAADLHAETVFLLREMKEQPGELRVLGVGKPLSQRSPILVERLGN